jgi:hypothetical protein
MPRSRLPRFRRHANVTSIASRTLPRGLERVTLVNVPASKRHLATPRQRRADPASAPRVVPIELRGRRVMTRLFTMAAELRASGVEPQAVTLTRDDEQHLFHSAEATFGPAAAEAAKAGEVVWREFLVTWFKSTVKLALTCDAAATTVL